MSVHLNSIPTTNSLGEINLRITFIQKKKDQATLNVGEALSLTISFDSIGVGTSRPMTIYQKETPGEISVEPGNLAFIERIDNTMIALQYGSPGGTQKSIVFTR